MKQLNAKKAGLVGGFVTLAAVTAGQVYAALDPAIALGLTTVQTDFNSLLALVYPIMIAITVALTIFGLVKMFIKKSVGH